MTARVSSIGAMFLQDDQGSALVSSLGTMVMINDASPALVSNIGIQILMDAQADVNIPPESGAMLQIQKV